MPALPTVSHPKLDGRKLVPWGRFTKDYHQEEERFPLVVTATQEIWEVRTFTQKKGSDAGTKKAELKYLGTSTAENLAKWGIVLPTSPETPSGTNANLPTAAFGGTTSRQLTSGAAGTTGGTTGGGTTGGGATSGSFSTGTPSQTQQGNLLPQGSPNSSGSLATDTSWLDGLRNQVAGLGTTLGAYINALGIPGVNIPTPSGPNLNNVNNNTGNNQAAGAAGTSNQGAPPPSPGNPMQGQSLLIVAAAGVALYFLLRKAK